jgi:hypothetical protein
MIRDLPDSLACHPPAILELATWSQIRECLPISWIPTLVDDILNKLIYFVEEDQLQLGNVRETIRLLRVYDWRLGTEISETFEMTEQIADLLKKTIENYEHLNGPCEDMHPRDPVIHEKIHHCGHSIDDDSLEEDDNDATTEGEILEVLGEGTANSHANTALPSPGVPQESAAGDANTQVQKEPIDRPCIDSLRQKYGAEPQGKPQNTSREVRIVRNLSKIQEFIADQVAQYQTFSRPVEAKELL